MSEKNDAVQKYQDAKAELERVARRDGWESDDYLAANDKVADLEKTVPWYRR